jgi:acyl-CoA synthetase (AMP-forming)/AMP-acid ligase II/acyl carrier protein
MGPDAQATILGALRYWACARGSRRAFTFLSAGEATETAVSITFGELHRRAQALAGQLRPLCRPGDRILLMYPPGIDYIVGLLATLYAGAAAVPAYPPHGQAADRALAIARDATPVMALTVAATLARVERAFADAASDRPVCLAGDTLAAAEPGIVREPEPDALALLQYTSGSTGTPKGVCVTHRALMHNQRMIRDAFGSGHDDKVVGWLPLYHDMGLVGTVLHALYMGIESVLMSPAHFLQRPVRWLDAISRQAATISGGPDFAFALCAERVGPEDKARLDLSRWSIAFNGSERVRPDTLARFARAFEPCGFRPAAFRPCYGLAEATLIVTGGRVRQDSRVPLAWGPAGDAAAAVSGPQPFASCGPPVLDTQVRIVAPDTGTLLPEDVIGEIWVHGPAVSCGYWHERGQPAAHEGRLVEEPGRSFLRTGDLGFLHGGELFPTGRLKDLVIVRGQNHLPDDLEVTATASHPDLVPNGAAAFAVDDGQRERLVFVLEVRRRFEDPADAVIRAVREAVAAEHQIAVDGVTLIPAGSLPRTSSGKTRRGEARARYLSGTLRALARWDQPAVPSDPSGAAAGDDLDPRADAPTLARWIAQRISRQLGVAEAGIEEPLDRVGLDSLAAAALVHDIEERLGRSVPADVLLAPTTPLHAARRILSGATEDAPAEPGAGERADLPTALTPGQLSLWLLHQMAPAADPYHIATPLRLTGALDVDALRAALEALMARHDALRTFFIDGPLQQIHEQVSLPWTAVDAGGWSEAQLGDAMVDAADAPFDLGRGCLARFILYRLAPERHVLLIVVHHIVCDGWSMEVLQRDLARLYDAATGGGQLDTPAVSLAAYGRWQARRLAGEAVRSQLDYWVRQLTPPGPPLLPSGANREGRARRRPLAPAAGLARGVARLARQLGVSPYVVFVAGLQAALAQVTSQSRVVFGTDVANRPHHWMRSIVGLIVNQVVLCDDVEGESTFARQVERAGALVGAALRNQEVPFSRVVSALNPPRRLGGNPLFQLMFTYRNRGLPRHEVRGLRLEAERELQSRRAKFDATLALTCDGGALSGYWEFGARIVETGCGERLAAAFESLLARAVEQPGSRLRELRAVPATTAGPAPARPEPGPASAPGRRPAIVESRANATLADWLAGHGDELAAHMRDSGAVLFRGFRVTTIGAFHGVARALCGEVFTENPEHTAVSRDGAVQTPVAYAQDRFLLWHNENSFNDEWPLRIAFCCLRPAESGGETPLVDSCLVLRELHPEVRGRFVDRGVAYVRHFGSGLGLDWRTVFRTDSREAVERYCREHHIVTEWQDADRLRTVAVRPAVVAHPLTGDLSWFNQAQHWHPACLDPDVRGALEGSLGVAGLPRNCTFGDGSPIPDDDMRRVIEVYRGCQVVFPWRQGDVLLLDNVLWAHGRNPYAGRRTMLVAMGSLQRWEQPA